jgi:hypothetical protein
MKSEEKLSAELWYQSPEMRVKENMSKKISLKATVFQSCNTVVEKFVRISLLFIILYFIF